MTKKLTLFTLLFTACCSIHAETIFDFEREDEQAPRFANKDWQIGVTNRYATSGNHSLFFHCASWKNGMARWPSFNLLPKITDWSGYDRLVIDLINLDDGFSALMSIISLTLRKKKDASRMVSPQSLPCLDADTPNGSSR